MLEGLVLDLGLEALGAEGEGVEVGREDGVDDAGRVAEDLHERSGADAFELVVEDVVEVAGFEDEFFAEDVLVDADVVGAGALRAGRRDVVLGDVSGVAGCEELVVEAGELEGEGGLLHAGGGVGADLGAVEATAGGTDGNIGDADARSSGDAVEVFFSMPPPTE